MPAAVQDHKSRRRSLYMLVLSHSDTHYLNRHMVGCGCYEILISLCYPDEVFCLAQKVLIQPTFSIELIRETLRDDIRIGSGGTKQINPDAWNCMVRVPVNINSVNSSLFLPFLLFSNVGSGRCLFVVQNRIIPSQNGNLFGKLKWIILLSMIKPSVLSICLDSRLICLFIFTLGSTAPCGWPSASVKFLHSASVTLRHLSLFTPEHNCRRRSLPMLVLSHSDTHHLNRHMGGCGCHEILIQPSFNVLFFTRFCHFRSTSSSFSLSVAVSQIEELLDKIPIFSENWSESSFYQWFSRQFSAFAQTLSLSCLFISSSVSICQSKIQLQKAFSPNAGALSLWHSLPQ